VRPPVKDIKTPNVDADYETDTDEVSLMIWAEPQTPRLNSDRIVSVADIPGSTMVVWGSELIEKAAVEGVIVKTARGQQISVDDEKKQNWQVKKGTVAGTVYWHRFPVDPIGKR
jgi:uncharacterized ubiquitin-like protein YukD